VEDAFFCIENLLNKEISSNTLIKHN